MNDGAILVKLGRTSVTLLIWLYNATTGALETGVTITDLNMDYIRIGTDNDVTIAGETNLTALANLTDAYAANKAYEIGHGAYRIDVPDAAFAVGVNYGSIIITHDDDTILPAKIDWYANAVNDLTAQQTRDAMKLSPTAGSPAVGSVDKHLDDIVEVTGVDGEGNVAWIYQLLDGDNNPVPDVLVEAKVSGIVIQTQTSDVNGNATFYLAPNTYDFYATKAGFNFTNPDTEVVS